MAAALALSSAAAAVSATAGAQTGATIVVQPGVTDPGALVTVTNGPFSACPPGAARDPAVSIDLYGAGSATPANRTPYQGPVSPAGTWSVQVRLEPDLPPGTYQVRAGCYTDSGLNSGYGPAYAPARLDLRLQEPGQASLSVRRGRPGAIIEVRSGEARCTPPAGSPTPRVRVSFHDATKATRAEAEGVVDGGSGRWLLSLRVPDLTAQAAEITAVCLARVGAPAPYARYAATPFTVEAIPQPVTTTSAPPATVAPTVPGAPTTVPRPTVSLTPSPTTLPPTPLAVAVVAEPTYTG